VLDELRELFQLPRT